MAHAKPDTQAYLQGALHAKALGDAGRLLELRRSWRATFDQEHVSVLGSASLALSPEGSERTQAAGELASIRADFYEGDATKILQRIELAQKGVFPDLIRQVLRMRAVWDRLSEIRRAKADMLAEAEFFEDFQTILIAPQRTAAELRWDWVRRMEEKSTYVRVMPALQRLHKDHPSVFAMEAPWFGQLHAAQKRAKASKPQYYVLWLVLIWLGVEVIRRMIQD